MTEDDSDTMLEQFVDSRRSFLEKGALATGAAAVGLGSLGFVDAGSASAPVGNQPGNETDTPAGDDGGSDGGGEALMFNDELHLGAQFRVTSPVVEQDPTVQGIDDDALFDEYNTRIVEALNTNEEAYFFPTHEAEVEQGEVYELHDEFALWDDASGTGLARVQFEPVGDDEALIPNEDGQLDPVEDFGITDGGGKALIQASDFHSGALLRITSGVVEWTPRPDVAGSDIFSAYNTRHARYLNTGDEVRVYTAHEGEFESGAVYVVRDEFDITDPEGQLVTADLDRVNEDDLDDDLLETA